MRELENKVAIVSGAGSGLGQAIALAYAKEGASVMASDINESSGCETVEMILKSGGIASFFKADSSLDTDNARLVQATIDKFGRLDIACNNAGISGKLAITGEIDPTDWQKVVDINLNGVFYACKHQLVAMEKNGGGVIVNMASIHGSVAIPMASAYTATKHAVVGLTKNIGVEYGKKNIRCNAVGPAYIETPLLAVWKEEQKQSLIEKHPLGRLGKPEEVADLVVFLSSDKSSFLTGGYYLIDGGYSAV